ncbi:MAG: Legume-like lectin family protein [Verrucomicrobiales bacterium]|nr:Legume-like lectin family protein [Verrucomicrobiales bacterium]
MLKRGILAILASASLLQQSRAGIFNTDFNSGLPPNTSTNGTAVIDTKDGIGNSGVLKLVSNLGNQLGLFLIGDLDSGAPVYGFDLSFKAAVGHASGTPADGWNVDFAQDVSPTAVGEDGSGNGLRVVFDTYNNSVPPAAPEAPSVDVWVGGAVVASKLVPIAQLQSWSNSDHYGDVNISLKPDGSLNVAFNGTVFYTNFFIPNFQPLSGALLAIDARTGGATENVWIDNLSFKTYLAPVIGFPVQPRDTEVLPGHPVTFEVQISNGEGATLQWLKNGSPILGAMANTYTVDNPAAESGNKYSVQVTSGAQVATSREATLKVVDLVVPAPQTIIDFTDGIIPDGTTLFGSATVDTTGGVNDSGGLKLTLAEQNDEGYFSIPNTNSLPVYGFTIEFDVLAGGGGDAPADGFSVNFASDLPAVLSGLQPEEGIGTGASIDFDLFNNGGGEAPSIDVKTGGVVISSLKVPISFLDTGTDYHHVIIRMENDGTIDVACNGIVAFDNLQTTFSSITGGQILFGARTGGSFENQWFDNIQFSTVTTAPIRILQQPVSTTGLVGSSASFSVKVNDTVNARYQWFRNGQIIADATNSVYTLTPVTSADAGVAFKVRVAGPNNVQTSSEAVLSTLALTAPASPDLFVDFNSAVPATVARIYGNAAYRSTGGAGGSGYVSLTDAVGSQSGAFVVQPLAAGAELNAFTVAFDVRVGGGGVRPADGWSFDFGSDIAEGTVGGAEDGTGTGLTVGFDIYDNSVPPVAPEAPSIDVRFKGNLVAQLKVPLSSVETGSLFAPVIIRVESDGTLDLAFNGQVIYNNLRLPGWAPLSKAKYGWYARTGGAVENQWLDNVKIGITKTTGPLRITQDPVGQGVLVGHIVTFTGLVSDPAGVTYQWLKNGSPMSGATSNSFTILPAIEADNGVTYSFRATRGTEVVTSAVATLSVLTDISVTSPQFVANFDEALPDGALSVGAAVVDTGSAGGNDTMVLHLTDDIGATGGGFIIQDFNNGTPVAAFTASFKLLIGLNAGTPADGLAFAFGSGLPDAVWGPGGPSTGLVLGFDTYDNGGEAPSINLFWKGELLRAKKLPIADVLTGDHFEDVFIRLQSDGTVDVVYKNNVIFSDVQLPGFAPVAGAKFGFGAATGGASEAHWIDDVKIAVSTAGEAPRITGAQLQNGNLVIQFTGGGTLESTSDLGLNVWTPVANGTTSPVSIPANGAAQFFRVRL